MSEFIQLEFQLAGSDIESVEFALFEIGALAVSLQSASGEALFELVKGGGEVWQQLKLQALFNIDADLDSLQQGLTQIIGAPGDDSWKLNAVEDKDWHRAWMDRFNPICFGERLWVCPSWKPVPAGCQYPIILDPGTAFGTGTHPTTALCLEWLDQFDCGDKRVIDFGCGSGVLAIAAALLGACYVSAIDNDHDAVEHSQENCVKNGLSEAQIKSHHVGSYPDAEESADVVLANILAGPLVVLAAEICALLKPGGNLILSGILDFQIEEITTAYGDMVRFQPPVLRDEWVLLSGTKQ
ncbi:MAG: 50S ribosomal protein L11 methyltransferase [Pseudomonadales bacterium]